ncbi:hypothetical protein PSTT_03601 [Puccinia striiformis]|uniref:HORMA domain-containing protein n=1 Tax=Puccinia striiformis TaxID=27350 RepID=A0A2S4VVT4_9BASI|nr:hypothetical protein PSTT_03601 [Puccinia striiformis]
MNDKDDQPPSQNMTFNETLRLIGEFLEVAFHQILYLRNVYPAGMAFVSAQVPLQMSQEYLMEVHLLDLFEQRKKFNVQVMSSRHPVLTSYIGEVISQSMEEVVKGLAKKLILAVQDNSTIPPKPREHFVFNLQYLVDPIATFENEADRDIRYGSKADAELHIRAFLIKLNSCNVHLGEPIKQDLTWTTFLELNDSTKEPISEHSKKNDHPPQWIPCDDPDEQTTTSTLSKPEGSDLPSSSLAGSSKRLIPLKSQGLGMIQLQMLVIQHNEKKR